MFVSSVFSILPKCASNGVTFVDSLGMSRMFPMILASFQLSDFELQLWSINQTSKRRLIV